MKNQPITWSDVLHHVDTTYWSSITTKERRYSTAERVINYLGPTTPCSTLTQAGVDELTTHLGRKVHGTGTISPNSLRQYLTVVSTLLKGARALGADLPEIKLSYPRKRERKRVIFTEEEEAVVVGNLELLARSMRFNRPKGDPDAPKPNLEYSTQQCYRFGWWFRFMLNTGMRPSESFRIEDSHILNRGTSPEGEDRISLLIPETKTGEPRTIPLNKVAQQAVSACQPYGLWRDYDTDSVRERYWVRMMNLCQFHYDYNLYDLRHSYITRMVRKGMDYKILQKLVGHSSIAQTMEYVHHTEEDAFEAVEAVS